MLMAAALSLAASLASSGFELPSRWTDRPLAYHAEQHALWNCEKRFVVVEAGRRSGKTELPKRRGTLAAWQNTQFDDYLVLYGAPTWDQAQSIYWNDLKALQPPQFIDSISESKLRIRLVNGATIGVVGVDKPERFEGQPIDWFFGDEFANWKLGIWDRNLRPALSTPGRFGRAWLYGVPRPSVDFQKLVDLATIEKHPDFAYFHWTSSTVLPKEEVDAARASMDPLMFAQEYEASRVNFAGRAYYAFERGVHARLELPWIKDAELLLSFDFNNRPGTAAISHEYVTTPAMRAALPELADTFTGTFADVHIDHSSTSELVANQICRRFGEHRGYVLVYGDATGGAGGSAKVQGSDWAIIERILRATFGDRVRMCVASSNPLERVRVNTVNWALRSADGKVHYLVDGKGAPHLVKDFENTVTLPGTDGELDKDPDTGWTHLTDGVGYLLHRRHPLRAGVAVQTFM
ncbi:MAG: hypothetical protein IT459_14840 [Planctomycetes bacterium]|nr:hypothetical protein [Planctomycetota bacterium]